MSSVHDEAQALKNAEQRGEKRSDKKWEKLVAEKETALAEKDTLIAELQAKLGK